MLQGRLLGGREGQVAAAISRALARAGGRGLLVGGCVRDALLGRPVRDLDLEVYGLALERVESVLGDFGSVARVGRSFGVLRLAGLDIDVSLPRRDSKTAPGHRGFSVEVDPELPFEAASRRRDLTLNSIGFDPETKVLLDPHGGLADLTAGVLRATDPRHFSEDPLRGLRVAQLAARLEMRPEAGLVALCGELDLSELPGERCWGEFRKWLLQGVRPSLGLAFLHESRQLRFFPELEALHGVPQDPRWHPEGDVLVHTGMALDAAVALRDVAAVESREALVFGVLCHDLGKPETTRVDAGRVRALGHDRAGVAPTQRLLERLRASTALIAAVCALVRHHLAPAQWFAQGASDRAYRRLARELEAAGTQLQVLEAVARADAWGRTTEDARAERFPAGDAFLARAEALAIQRRAPVDVVQGRHLLARGLEAGPRFGEILRACRAVQDETGESDVERILAQVLEARDGG
ncbi:MAG: HD domain-containing protein [Proteobacteria bacterium]|nr:HD domain-containing protein [Pseudomonadota bacterium]